MADGGIDSIIPFVAPQLYGKMLPIQRRQAMAQMLMQGGMQQPQGAYGGLANAGKMIAGALLGRSADSDLANLYSSDPLHTGQISNGVTPETQDAAQNDDGSPVTPSQLNLSPGISPDTQGPPANAPSRTQQLGAALQGNSPPQGTPGVPPILDTIAQWQNPSAYVLKQQELNAPTEFQRNMRAAGIKPGSPQWNAGMHSWLVHNTQTEQMQNSEFAAGAPGTNATAQQLSIIQNLPPELKPVATQFGLQSPQYAQAADDYLKKNNAIALGRNGSIVNGDLVLPPNEFGFQPTATGTKVTGFNQIPGYSEALAGARGETAGAQAAAQSMNTLHQYQGPGGESLLAYGNQFGAPPGAKPFMQYNMPQGQPGSTPPPQGAPAARPNAPAPIAQGQTTADQALAQKRAEAVALDAKIQSAAQNALDALDQMDRINQFTPGSSGASPEFKADVSKRLGFAYGDKDAAQYLAQWEQLNETGVMAGLRAMEANGGVRSSSPLISHLESSNGISADLPPQARTALTAQLRGLIKSEMIQSKNTVARLNNPNALASTQVQPPPPASAYQPNGAPQAPPVAQRIPGQKYTTPKGVFTWAGHGWQQ